MQDFRSATNTPRSCLRWKPTGRIFKIAGLRWIPTGKMFTDNTTKVDSEPSNGSNDDITNSYECDQTLNVSAVQASLFNDKMTSVHISSGLALQRQNDASLFNDKMTSVHISSGLALQQQNDVCSHQFRPRSSTTKWRLQTSLQAPLLKEKKGVRFSVLYLSEEKKSSYNDWDSLFCPMFDEYFNPSPSVVQHVLVAVVQEPILTNRSSEGSGITLEVPDEPKDNSAVVAEKQARYVQTNLTRSSAELEIQSMVDVPIHQEDLAIQRTPLIDPVISMVTEKTASIPTPPTTQAHV
ncbi:hypothetical protein Tco_0596492 [Tanacetum coccineum]